MSSTIEATVKALVEFESELEKAKAEAIEAKRRVAKGASEWAESAKSSAISKAQEIATRRVAEARAEAEAQAQTIKEKGMADLKAFETAISRHRSRAADLVASRLLGETA
jgi:vacuolar-type H+-ATPase subunit H